MVKDCHILGHALRLSTLLAAAGYPNLRLLVSSNRSDFAAPNATVFHPDIVPDAAAAGLPPRLRKQRGQVSPSGVLGATHQSRQRPAAGLAVAVGQGRG
jgi:hypothetical protein